jgi:annexin A7/11
MKGFGTDEKTLISILASRDPLQVVAIREAFNRIHHRSLEDDIKGETSGYFERGLVTLLRGPLVGDVKLLHEALHGPGTKEKVLNDVLLGRSNADLRAIRGEYHRTFHQDLAQAVGNDLSFKTKRHFEIVLQANRAEDAVSVNKPEVDRDVADLYNATEGKVGTDEIKVCSILSLRNDNQIRAIAHEYRQRYARSLEDVIKSVSLLMPI